MNKIIITGSSGFVAKNLINYLVESKHHLIPLSRVSGFNYSNINFKYINSNSVDGIIHIAGKAHSFNNISNIDEYYKVNTELTINLFDAFLASKAKVFITLSSVKAVSDKVEGELDEEVSPNPITHYGKSKLLSDQYILSRPIPEGKRVYVLRPCMIHGPSNKGNLNLLYSVVSKGLPWPLGAYENIRSYLSIENLCFIIRELIDGYEIPSGVYNLADDVPISTNEIIEMIVESKGKKTKILNLGKKLIKVLARIGDFTKLPLNSERLQKLTESYVVSNSKIKAALGKPLPVSSKEGLIRTFQSFADNA